MSERDLGGIGIVVFICLFLNRCDRCDLWRKTVKQHVAILKPVYLDMILAGEKTVECRVTRTRQAPFGVVRRGESIWFKYSGGRFAAKAVAGEVEEYDRPTLKKRREIYRRLEPLVCGGDAFWRSRIDYPYLCFVHLERVTAIDAEDGIAYKPSAYKAWHVVEAAEARGATGMAMIDGETVFESVLTAGAIRNRYVLTPGDERGRLLNEKGFALELPDGKTVRTELFKSQRVRWRGWGPYFAHSRVEAGDRVRFVRVGRGRYRVSIITERS